MPHPILGLHHVTATVDAAQDDLDFCIDSLGLRLVKKTVNFDNHSVYHFYYGNESGTPGTIWTTFPYRGWGVPTGQAGAGQIRVTSFSVPAGSLEFWRRRLSARRVSVGESTSRFGETGVAFGDRSGLTFELVATDRDRRFGWTTAEVGADVAIRGLHSVTLLVRSPEKTVEFMRDLFGFQVVDETEGRIRLTVNGDEPGKTVDVEYDVRAAAARNGLGTVHHVAFAIAHPDEQRAVREELLGRGHGVTEVLDRQYFQSIYFREPGGVLFEVATMQPGFMIDESLPRLGETLKLPPWEEANRQVIEAQLPKVHL
jgi:glyoxalase family protein